MARRIRRLPSTAIGRTMRAVFRFGAILDRLPRPAARWSRLLGISALIGVIVGLAAAALEWGLHVGIRHVVGRFTHLGGTGVLEFNWVVLFLPAIGGLLSGVIVRLLCPESHGHGTDLLVRAFHHQLGDMPAKAPIVKAAAVVGVLSCGGSTGPEGPVAAMGAGIGSSLSRRLGVTPHERRVLLVAGCGAGVGAIFRCPLGGALFAAEILYSDPEFESDALVPALVSSVLGYSAFVLLWGGGAALLPGASDLAFHSPLELIPYAVLGPLCGLVALFFGFCIRLVERRLMPLWPLPRWLAPCVGGLATGALACVLPQVMDGQYEFIRNAMSDPPFGMERLPGGAWWLVGLFGSVVALKCVATACTVGSGASGGLLGPSVFIGGVTGAFLGAACEGAFPGMFPEYLREALIPVGMGGVLAAGMRTPLAGIVMVTEMTGGYGLIVPLMLVCGSAYVVGRGAALNSEQVRTTAESPAHAGDAVIHILESIRVDQIMERDWPMVARPEATLRELVAQIRPGTRPVFAVVREGRILGVISVSDIRRVLEEPALAEVLIAQDMMTERPATVYADEDVYQALSGFRLGAHDVVPVVLREKGRRWVGMLTRERVFETLHARIGAIQRQVLREHAGLAAIEQEGRLQQLVMGLPPQRKGQVQRLMVPLDAVGNSLRACDFRRRYGAQVIAVEQPDGALQSPPDIDAPLRPDHRLLAIVESSEDETKA